MESLPIPSNDVKKVIADYINKEGLETVTSGKIRNHLKETFDQDFKPFKKLIDKLTEDIIDEQNGRPNEDGHASDSDKSPDANKEDSREGKSAENSGSDDDDDMLVLSTERARPSKKTRKRKASQDDLENLDLMSSVKSGRRTAAKEAANKLRKAAGWAARKKDTSEKKEKGKITKGTKLVYVSEELQSIVGQKFMRRCDVVKEFWRYVRENERMDPKDKRFALVEGDAALERVFKGKRRIQMFGVMSHLSHRHLMTPEDVGQDLVEECEIYRAKLIAAYEASKSADLNDDDSDKDTKSGEEDNIKKDNIKNTNTNDQQTLESDSD